MRDWGEKPNQKNDLDKYIYNEADEGTIIVADKYKHSIITFACKCRNITTFNEAKQHVLLCRADGVDRADIFYCIDHTPLKTLEKLLLKILYIIPMK